ncbi:MAG: hypothetical protein ACRENB_11435 [Gemmatimonadales bacterium]
MYVVLAIGGGQRMPLHELHARAEAAARKAVALDDSLAEAHAALGFVRSVQFDFGSAEALFANGATMTPWHSSSTRGAR